MAQNPENPNFSPFFLYFLGGANLGANLGSYFFLFWDGGPRPIFYQVGRFSTLSSELTSSALFPLR